METGQRMPQGACPSALSEWCCQGKCQPRDATSRVCSQLATGSSGVMTQVWGLLSILLHGSIKRLSQADPMPGSILRRPKRAEMSHCSPSPSQGCPLAVPGHHPGHQEGKVSPLLLIMAMALWHGSQRQDNSSGSWLGIGELGRNRTRKGLGVEEGVR